MTNGINGDYGQFKKGNILQPNGIQNGEVKKAEAAPNEPIINFNTNNNKEIGFDLLTQNAGSAYGKALTLSTDVVIDKALTKGLSGKEMAALQKELSRPGVTGRVGNVAVSTFSMLEALDEFNMV